MPCGRTLPPRPCAGGWALRPKSQLPGPIPLARSRKRAICVYTPDFHDHEEVVTRVLVALRDLGSKERLSYKTDVDTLAGRYGSGAAICVTCVTQSNDPLYPTRQVLI
jgi:hypothetical protein